MKLTDLKIRQSQPKDKAYKITDGGGLFLQVNSNGTKYWRLKYRIMDKEKLLALGTYPAVSLAQAREKREEAKKTINQGIDPIEQKRAVKRDRVIKANNTMELIAREWHTRHYDQWSQRHADNILHRLEMDIFPVLGKLPIHAITPPILLEALQKIEDRGANEIARRALQVSGQVFRYAVVTGRAERDVSVDLKGALKKYKKSHYAAIDGQEIPALLKAIDENRPRLYRQTILAVKLLMLTFVRTSELIEATWSEFDFDKAEWHIPAERMKMRLPHVVPLSQQVITMLQELQEMNGKREFILPSLINPRKHMSNGTILGALKRLGYHKRMTGHGFRALAMSTIKEELGYRHEVVDRQLAHVPANQVDRAYDRAKFLPERRIMMQKWADYIDLLHKNSGNE